MNISPPADVPVYFVAFRDHGDEMIPASAEGRLLLYPDHDDARAAAGALGVAAAQRWPHIQRLCRRHGLALPAVDNGGAHE